MLANLFSVQLTHPPWLSEAWHIVAGMLPASPMPFARRVQGAGFARPGGLVPRVNVR